MSDTTGALSVKQRKKLARIKEKINAMEEEHKTNLQQSKNLKYKISRLEKEKKQLDEKDMAKKKSLEDLKLSKVDCEMELVSNEGFFKKIMSIFTSNKEEVEEKKKAAHIKINEIDKKIVGIEHFLEKHDKKKSKIKAEVKELREELVKVEENLVTLNKSIKSEEKSLQEVI